jgi:hypothetical protein
MYPDWSATQHIRKYHPDKYRKNKKVEIESLGYMLKLYFFFGMSHKIQINTLLNEI